MNVERLELSERCFVKDEIKFQGVSKGWKQLNVGVKCWVFDLGVGF